MGVRDELRAELHDAIRGKDRARADAVRMVETEVAVAKSDPGFDGEVDDALYVSVIADIVKRNERSRREYEALGERGAGQAAKLATETAYLSRWLPSSLGEDETLDLVRATIADLGATDPKQAGQVIGAIMKKGVEGLDGALVNQLVRRELSD